MIKVSLYFATKIYDVIRPTFFFQLDFSGFRRILRTHQLLHAAAILLCVVILPIIVGTLPSIDLKILTYSAFEENGIVFPLIC